MTRPSSAGLAPCGAIGRMNTTIPDLALALVLEVLSLAPPSPVVTHLMPGATIATILRQCGTVAGIASERARGDAFKLEWAGIEGVTLLACFAIERHIDGDDESARRMIAMARVRLSVAKQASWQEAVAS